MGKRYDFTAFLADEKEEIKKSLTKEEKEVFDYRSDGASVVETSLKLRLCEKTVSRRSRSIQHKIDRMHARQRRQTTEYHEKRDVL